jgi:hypothetical protein
VVNTNIYDILLSMLSASHLFTEETETITIDPVHGGIIWFDESDGTILLRDSEINSNAAFFVTPKFDRDMVDRELREIDSEYRNGITNDAIS